MGTEGVCGGNQRTLSDQLDSGRQRWMDPHSARSLQTEHIWMNNLCDGEVPGGYLTTLHPKEWIMVLYHCLTVVDTLANPVGRKELAMLVGIGSIVV